MNTALLKDSALILPPSVSREKDLIWTPKKDLLFRIGKYRDRAINDPMVSNLGIGNYIRLECMNLIDGSKRWLTPWFHNNITNVGMDLCATSTTRFNACQVGTGNAPVDDTNTTLQNRIAGTTTVTTISDTCNNGALRYSEYYLRYDFTLGGVIGNISEIGIGPLATAGSNLFCRELIRDETGTPTTIPLNSDIQLRVHYKVRVYPPIIDVTGVVNGTLLGSAASRNFTTRASSVGSTSTGGWTCNLGSGVTVGKFGNVSYIGASNTALQPIADTASPSPTSSGATFSESSYTPGNFHHSTVVTLLAASYVGNLKRFIWPSASTAGAGNRHNFQCEFDTPIAKTNTQSLTLTFRTTWNRYVE